MELSEQYQTRPKLKAVVYNPAQILDRPIK
jgi:hypothetical protein